MVFEFGEAVSISAVYGCHVKENCQTKPKPCVCHLESIIYHSNCVFLWDDCFEGHGVLTEHYTPRSSNAGALSFSLAWCDAQTNGVDGWKPVLHCQSLLTKTTFWTCVQCGVSSHYCDRQHTNNNLTNFVVMQLHWWLPNVQQAMPAKCQVSLPSFGLKEALEVHQPSHDLHGVY